MVIKRTVDVSVVVGLLLSGVTPSWGRAKTQPFLGTFAGTATSTTLDTNGDGVPASLGIGVIVSTQGRFASQNVSEFLPPLSIPVHCSAGMVEVPLLVSKGIDTREKDGDQLFFEYTSGVVCLNPDTKASTFSGEGVFTGGTGRFAGVTGAFTAQGTSSPLVVDSAGRSFGSRVVKFRGTLTFPGP